MQQTSEKRVAISPLLDLILCPIQGVEARGRAIRDPSAEQINDLVRQSYTNIDRGLTGQVDFQGLAEQMAGAGAGASQSSGSSLWEAGSMLVGNLENLTAPETKDCSTPPPTSDSDSELPVL